MVTENDDNDRNGKSDEAATPTSTDGMDGDAASDLTCTLSEADAAARREFAATHLAGRLVRIDPLEAGAAVHLERTEEAYQAVTTLLWRESRCCDNVDLSVALPADGDTIEWRVESQRTDAAATFVDQIRAVLGTS